jgi:hypothetical protein
LEARDSTEIFVTTRLHGIITQKSFSVRNDNKICKIVNNAFE